MKIEEALFVVARLALINSPLFNADAMTCDVEALNEYPGPDAEALREAHTAFPDEVEEFALNLSLVVSELH